MRIPHPVALGLEENPMTRYIDVHDMQALVQPGTDWLP